MNQILVYAGAGLTMLWGIAHLFPTRSVVKGFGKISVDNERIMTMEWIVEGVALILLGLIAAAVNAIDPVSAVSRAVTVLVALGLLVLAVVSLFTGFKVRFLPFRLCPLIFTVSAVLILFGGLA